MIIGVAAETYAGERRVALVPESIERLTRKGLEVRVENGAGAAAGFADEEFGRAGARLVLSSQALFGALDLAVKIHPPSLEEAEALRQGASLICPLYARRNPAVARRLVARNISTFALENLPRTTVAQAMDVLSSQSTAAGYRAVIVAAHALAKFFPLLMTPAGTIAPARVLVIGAGVAGLQAIATARRLGAVVEAFDVRPAVREEVESLGAKFIVAEFAGPVETAEGYARELDDVAQRRARAAIERALVNVDACITTALLPAQRAPLLLTANMVRRMRPGSVIVDLAAAQGGNCQLTQPGKDIVQDGVAVIGRFHLAAEVALDASRMYSRNLEKLLDHLIRDGVLHFDGADEISRRCLLTHCGTILDEELRRQLEEQEGAMC
ncbi:MAG: NAD(P) transhydrogenase subunit alpha [Chloroflexota bacterium]